MRSTFIVWVVVALYCPAGGAVRCCAQTVAGGPVGGMECTRIGPLGPVPKLITERFPLSDQENRGGWVKYEPMSDEFEGTELDASKWYPNNPDWLGRQPAFFWRGNVSVHDGKLHLAMRKQEVPEMPKDKGYHDYTSAAVQSKTTVLYGYFEVKAKAMNSAGSSSFWFYNRTPHLWTEIDVYELTGKGAKLDDGELVSFENKYNMHLHVFRTPEEDRHWYLGSAWVAPWRFADDYHVYGLEWDERSIKWYLDGVLVRSDPNTHWHQPLTLNFDSETMPTWFGMPKDEDLPSTYSIEYVRSWKQAGGGAGGSKPSTETGRDRSTTR